IDQAGNKVSSINEKNKSFIFSGKANYTKIEIKQTVSGNAGDKEKCFEYKFAIDNSTEYNLETSSVCNNSSKIANGGSVYLRKDDVVTIGNDGTNNEIPVGSVYSFAKVGDNDYTTTWDGATTSADNSGDKTMVAIAATDYNSKNVTTVNREKNIAVNTGVVMGSIIYIILAIAGVAGLTYMVKSKKNA
ncbi:MAG: hypothetical protein MJ154_03905, partial [Candidatus Saccharibacteria bacterium]|nr:hypothetical protein [Candidatus Saccharibacteria bacterium]